MVELVETSAIVRLQAILLLDNLFFILFNRLFYKNIKNPKQLKKFTSRLKNVSVVPPILAVDDEVPASLSYELITAKLRQELDYQGVIVTDGLNMGAIEKNYGSGEACVLAFEAGNDILLMPNDFNAAYKAVLSAVQSNRISIARLDESVHRILKLKGF